MRQQNNYRVGTVEHAAWERLVREGYEINVAQFEATMTAVQEFSRRHGIEIEDFSVNAGRRFK